MTPFRHPALVALALALAVVPARAQAPAADAIAAGAFAYDRAAPLALRDSLESVADGIETYAISFDSPRGGRATGLLYVPQSGGRRPAVLSLHGAPGNARQIERSSLALARRGAVVLALDAPFARRDGRVPSFTPADSADQVQLVVDLQRAMDLLLARPDVDPARVAFVGGSFGGAVGVMYAAVDPRPAGYVLFVADGGIFSHFADADGRREPRLQIPDAVWERWAAAMRPVEGIGYAARIRPGTVLFQNGRDDAMVPAWKAEALHRAAGPSHAVRWYDSGHGLPATATMDRYQWLAERIGIRAPSAEEVARAAATPPPAQPAPRDRRGDRVGEDHGGAADLRLAAAGRGGLHRHDAYDRDLAHLSLEERAAVN